MMKAIWNKQIIAESDDVVKLEGNIYFPEESVQKTYLKKSQTQTVCPWKGTASYYTVEVDGEKNEDAAWTYAEPSSKAASIKGRIAFWKGVQILE